MNVVRMSVSADYSNQRLTRDTTLKELKLKRGGREKN